MRTSEEVYHRVRWDQRFDPARFVLGVTRRGTTPKRMPLPAFVPGGEIPWHRIVFIEADGELLWDRATGVDRIDSSRAGRVRDPRRLRAPFFTALTPYAWEPAVGWTPSVTDGTAAPAAPDTATAGAQTQPTHGRPASANLRVLTWNTLWDRYDSDRIDTARRRPLLLDALEESGADVIALQEVEPALLDLLARADWVRSAYTLHTNPNTTKTSGNTSADTAAKNTADSTARSTAKNTAKNGATEAATGTASSATQNPARNNDVDDNGLLILSRLPVREAAQHTFGPHKAVIAVTVATANGPLVVAATHLTSDHAADGAARRDTELAELAEGLADIEGDVLLVGDFNDGGSGSTGPAVALGLRDAWTDVHGPLDHTPTFDPGANPLAAVSSLSGRASRLDRILLRTGGAAPAATAQAAAPTASGIPGASPTTRSAKVVAELRPSAAVLRGDVPSPDGLFISDHFGVEVEFGLGDSENAAGNAEFLDCAPTARTALAWLPPPELWPRIQDIRRRHDPQFDRWPPHVNLLFGFVPESEFERAAALVAAVAAEIPPFAVKLDGVDMFGHRDDATVWLDPAADGEAPWAALRHALVRRFPHCRGRAEGFTPHLTLGRSKEPQRVAADCGAQLPVFPTHVGELVLLSRRGDEPMRPRIVVELGTGDVRRAPDAGPEPASAAQASGTPGAALIDHPDPTGRTDRTALRIMRRVAEALPNGVVHTVGSRRTGCALPTADIDLVAALPGPADVEGTRRRIADAFPDAVRLRHVVGARVPGLRFAVGGTEIDLVTVPTGSLAPSEAAARRVELGEAAALALSAVSDAEAVRDAVADQPQFPALARRVKAWAKARGLASAPYGGLPGVAWAVLAARTTLGAPGLTDEDALLRRFFADWAAWDWRDPTSLGTPPEPLPGTRAPVTVLTPTAPIRNCAEQVGPGGRDLLTQELYRAWEILEASADRATDADADADADSGTDAWAAILAPPDLHRRHRAWAVLTVRPDPGEEFDTTMGRVRGRVRALLTALEDAGVADAHFWPRPFETASAADPSNSAATRGCTGAIDCARYAIGLGRTPPDADQLAGITDRWLRGLPGTGITWAPCGDVPTLR